MPFSFKSFLDSDSVAVMGILNLSPESFYSGNFCSNADEALRMAEQLVKEGAQILDVGAQSTRPGLKNIPVKIELERLLPVIPKIINEFKVPISIDTQKAEVASIVLQEGAVIINDVSGLRDGGELAKVVAQYEAGIVIMHMQGTPETMQKNPRYTDVISEIFDFLKKSIKIAENSGIVSESIAVDPGIGFGKTLDHNLEIIARLGKFKELDKNILLGVSRKSFLGKILDLDVDDRLEGSLAAGIIGVVNGANILRVHDVAATVRAVQIVTALKRARKNDQAFC